MQLWRWAFFETFRTFVSTIANKNKKAAHWNVFVVKNAFEIAQVDNNTNDSCVDEKAILAHLNPAREYSSKAAPRPSGKAKKAKTWISTTTTKRKWWRQIYWKVLETIFIFLPI